MLTLQAEGVRLAYTTDGSGRDTVFVHGIPTDYRAWEAQVTPFSNRYRVITYSRRHAQPNDNQGSMIESTVENNARDLESLIRHVASPPINLVGHSYGGFIAAYVAAKAPDLVKKLVLIEPGISTLLVQDPNSRAQMLSLLLHSPRVALAAGSYLRRYYNPLLEAYRKGELNASLGYFLDGLMNRTGALDQLPERVRVMLKENAGTIGELEAKPPSFTKKDARLISAPTLLINGANGTQVFRAINNRLSGSIPVSEHVLIPEASHFPHFESPQKFNEAVLRFLERS